VGVQKSGQEDNMGVPTLDQFAVCGFQVVLVLLVLSGLLKDRGWFVPHSPFEGSSVQRGETSLRQHGVAFGFTSVSVLQIIGSSDAFPSCKATLGFLDLAAMAYLFFFNGWFRGLVITWFSKGVAFSEPMR
jgi:hypothetical protein